MAIRRASWILVAALGALACAPGDDAGDPADLTPRAWEDNGFRLNGFRLNGFRLNGFRLNGGDLVGAGGESIAITSLKLANDTSIPIRWIYEGELKGYSVQTGVVSGAALNGAKLHFEVDEAGSYHNRMLKIVSVTPPGASPLWLYDVDIKESIGAWEPLCVDAQGVRQQVILIDDLWDPATGDRVRPLPDGAVTFACVDAAIGKCAQWGYVPWGENPSGDLAEYHQACTRAARADYCGDGISHTVDGTEIHVLDQIGVESAAPGGGFVIEAEWGPDGATCLDPEGARGAGETIACELPACGEPFASGGLIQTGTVTPS